MVFQHPVAGELVVFVEETRLLHFTGLAQVSVGDHRLTRVAHPVGQLIKHRFEFTEDFVIALVHSQKIRDQVSGGTRGAALVELGIPKILLVRHVAVRAGACQTFANGFLDLCGFCLQPHQIENIVKTPGQTLSVGFWSNLLFDSVFEF